MFSEDSTALRVDASDLLNVLLSPGIHCGIVLDRARNPVEATDRRADAMTGDSRAEFLDRLMALMDPDKLEPALSGAYAGRSGRQTVPYEYDGAQRLWDVRVMPLCIVDGRVEQVLIAGSDLQPDESGSAPTKGADSAEERTRDLVHGYANLASIGKSSARILKRGTVTPMIHEIAVGLEEAAQEADGLIERWREVMSPTS